MAARASSPSTIFIRLIRTRLDLDIFTDIAGRHFRQPKEGLGFDNSPVAHMWRSMIWPRNFL
jgi:hypothetical protein